jgi:hypothetical protein
MQLSVKLLSSIIEAILDAVPKPSNRGLVLQLLIDIQDSTLGNGRMEASTECFAPRGHKLLLVGLSEVLFHSTRLEDILNRLSVIKKVAGIHGKQRKIKIRRGMPLHRWIEGHGTRNLLRRIPSGVVHLQKGWVRDNAKDSTEPNARKIQTFRASLSNPYSLDDIPEALLGG